MIKQEMLEVFDSETKKTVMVFAALSNLPWKTSQLSKLILATVRHMVEALDYFRNSFAQQLELPSRALPAGLFTRPFLDEYLEARRQLRAFLEQISEAHYTDTVKHEVVKSEGSFEVMFWTWIVGHEKHHRGYLMALMRVVGGEQFEMPLIHGELREEI